MPIQSFHARFFRANARLGLAAILCVVTTLLLPRSLRGQTWGAIMGRVVSADAGLPLASVFIAIDGAGPRSRSDADGRFHIDGVSSGSHTIQARLGLALRPRS